MKLYKFQDATEYQNSIDGLTRWNGGKPTVDETISNFLEKHDLKPTDIEWRTEQSTVNLGNKVVLFNTVWIMVKNDN